jgi:hypothetical protein
MNTAPTNGLTEKFLVDLREFASCRHSVNECWFAAVLRLSRHSAAPDEIRRIPGWCIAGVVRTAARIHQPWVASIWKSGVRSVENMIAYSQVSSTVPKPSRFSGELQSRIPRIARRMRNRMSELGLNQTELSARCAGASQDLFQQDAPQITRERIAKILMHCKRNPGKSAARVITQRELQVFSSVLQVSPEWLAGQGESREFVLWDLLTEPHRAHHILHLINEHEDRAKEVIVWAEHLICSLETPEFMHKHHEALFSELDVWGAHEEKRKLVQLYDSIGNARRKRLTDSKQRRRKLVQLIFAAELRKIADGVNEYAGMGKELRRCCLQRLSHLLSEPSRGINLVVIDDKDADHVMTAFRDYDSVGVFDDSFVVWRYHSGRIAWSEHPEQAKRYHNMLKALESNAENSGETQAREFIERLTASIR